MVQVRLDNMKTNYIIIEAMTGTYICGISRNGEISIPRIITEDDASLIKLVLIFFKVKAQTIYPHTVSKKFTIWKAIADPTEFKPLRPDSTSSFIPMDSYLGLTNLSNADKDILGYLKEEE